MKMFISTISLVLLLLPEHAMSVAGTLAKSKNSEQGAVFGVSGRLTCYLGEDRPITSVVLSDHIDNYQRTIEFVGHSGAVKKQVLATCDFVDAFYECVWGKTYRLKIKMGQVYSSSLNRLNPRQFLSGSLKLDLFRPGINLSCALKTASKM